MKPLEINERTPITFSVPHPIKQEKDIPCNGIIRKLENDVIEVLQLFYTDPRRPDEVCEYYSPSERPTTPIYLQIPDEEPKTTTEEVGFNMSSEEVDDALVEQEVHSHIQTNILQIIKDNGFLYEA
jgi:hypothetical protein